MASFSSLSKLRCKSKATGADCTAAILTVLELDCILAVVKSCKIKVQIKALEVEKVEPCLPYHCSHLLEPSQIVKRLRADRRVLNVRENTNHLHRSSCEIWAGLCKAHTQTKHRDNHNASEVTILTLCRPHGYVSHCGVSLPCGKMHRYKI